MESFEKTISISSLPKGKGPGSTNLIVTFSEAPSTCTRSTAASHTGFSTSMPTTLLAPYSFASSTAQAPEPQPISITVLPLMETPFKMRCTSSTPPGDKKPSPQSSSKNAMTC